MAALDGPVANMDTTTTEGTTPKTGTMTVITTTTTTGTTTTTTGSPSITAPTPPSPSKQNKTSSSSIPSTTEFSFKAPLPTMTTRASSSAAAAAGAGKAKIPPLSTPNSPLSKTRRVSLALPSSPRVVPAWNFRDDTGLMMDSSCRASTSASAMDVGAFRQRSGSGSLERKSTKIRKIVSEDGASASASADLGDALSLNGAPDKKMRKKWTMEETEMLVKGCNMHGVGNWKTILSDSTLQFDNRSPVDLKDRFRTYFPDAYKQHYPNAKTHLSSKVRSTLPDGSSLFEKTRSKKRRPFTEEEDRALRAGYEKHGTVWATIVKDPVFQEQNRRSTDLRDRFRNAFPELYQAAGYKPRNAATAAAKKKRLSLGASPSAASESRRGGVGMMMPIRAATDDQLALSSTSSAGRRGRRRANTNQGLLRGGTKSVPQSATASEEEEESSGDEESSPVPLLPPGKRNPLRSFLGPTATIATTRMVQSPAQDEDETSEVEMDDIVQMPPEPDIDEVQPPHSSWPPPSDTPPMHRTWSTAAAASPTSSHLSSDYINNNNTNTNTPSSSSPFQNTRRNSVGMQSMMIGKSAWGTQDWLMSANPRLDHTNASSYSASGSSAASSSFIDESGLSPSSPFSFSSLHMGGHLSHLTLNNLPNDNIGGGGHAFNIGSGGGGGGTNNTSGGYGVLDRYDLFPSMSYSLSSPSFPQHDDFISEVGIGDSHSTFSDDVFLPGGNGGGFRGFTHHSNYAGDLIFGARTHQPLAHQGSFLTSANLGIHGSGVGNGVGAGAFEGGGMGLGLDVGQGTGIHPMQLHAPALPGIDEIELAGINLNDREDAASGEPTGGSGPTANDAATIVCKDDPDANPLSPNLRDPTALQQASSSQSALQPLPNDAPMALDEFDLTLPDLNDLVDMDRGDSSADGNRDEDGAIEEDEEMHETPPSTPLTSRPRLPLRKASFGSATMLRGGQHHRQHRQLFQQQQHQQIGEQYQQQRQNNHYFRQQQQQQQQLYANTNPTGQQQQHYQHHHHHQHHHQGAGAYGHHGHHGRSVSVPPTEARAAMSDSAVSPSTASSASVHARPPPTPTPQQIHAISQPTLSTSRSVPFFGATDVAGGGAASAPVVGAGVAASPRLPTTTTSSLSAMISPGPGTNSTLSSPRVQQQHQAGIATMTSSPHHPHINFIYNNNNNNNNTLNHSIPPTTTDVTSYPPFLDLHYYNNNHNNNGMNGVGASSAMDGTFPAYGQYTWYGQGGPGEVLDLAMSGLGGGASGGGHGHHLQQQQQIFGIEPSKLRRGTMGQPPPQEDFVFQSPQPKQSAGSQSDSALVVGGASASVDGRGKNGPADAAGGGTSAPSVVRSHSLHQRGQSVASSNRKTGDGGNNKRKRASWDGGGA